MSESHSHHSAHDDAALREAFLALQAMMDAPPEPSEGRPSNALLGREFKALAAMHLLESHRLRALAAELGSDSPPSDEEVYFALDDGAAIFAASRSQEKCEEWQALMARFAASNPGVLPPVRPLPPETER